MLARLLQFMPVHKSWASRSETLFKSSPVLLHLRLQAFLKSAMLLNQPVGFLS